MTALLLYLSNVHVVYIVTLAKEVTFSPYVRVCLFVGWLVYTKNDTKTTERISTNTIFL